MTNPANDCEFGAGNGDRIKLPGNLIDYTISSSGNQLTLEAPSENTIVISVSGTSTLEFADGLASLSLSFGPTGPEMNLGNAVIPDGETLTDTDSVFGVSIDTGTIDIPVNFDAGDRAYNFMDDASVSNHVFIDNFSGDDRISISNADVSDYSFQSTDSDVKITYNYNDEGIMNIILLTGIVSDAMVWDHDSFEAAFGFNAFIV